MSTWSVVDDRGQIVSRHRTEAAAWAAIKRREREYTRMANRSGLHGGGYGAIHYSVLARDPVPRGVGVSPKPWPIKERELALVDLDTVPIRIRMDYARRNANIEAGAALCDRCDGTGNELYSMWRRCPECAGSGIDGEVTA